MTEPEGSTPNLPQQQRRARRIALTPEEMEQLLAEQRTCRVGSIGFDGRPHVTPMWYAWDGASIWLYSILKSQRWTNLMRDPRVSVVVDTGDDYFELRGIEFIGRVEPIGEQPRTGEPNPELETAELILARRYMGGDVVFHDGRHAWLRLQPEKIVSWDFRKLDPGNVAFNPSPQG
ncbi:MAG: pyridoxamine 5'-phosphate oxidase family protein [Candidatus Dormiibacterota bacterium]